MSAAAEDAALSEIASGKLVSPAGRSKVRIGGSVVHVRFCSTNLRAADKYKFNINPNTLSADYELWVCGSADIWYLIPIAVMREIYENPNTYTDNTHPEIRVVSVDAYSHFATFASGGTGTTLKPYL